MDDDARALLAVAVILAPFLIAIVGVVASFWWQCVGSGGGTIPCFWWAVGS